MVKDHEIMQKETLLQKIPSKVIRVLLIEDNPGYSEVIRIMLERIGDARFDMVGVQRLSDGLQNLSDANFDVVLLDLKLPDSQGIDTFEKVHGTRSANNRIDGD
jgi:DNA-binding NarL/FixJ family response regulator